MLYKYNDTNLQDARGLFVDNNGNLVLIGQKSQNVHTITTEGKKLDVLLSAKDGLKCPWCVACSPQMNLLYICCKTVNVYKYKYE